MDEYTRNLNLFSSIAMGIVGFQFCRKVLPWIYVNVLGPKLLGSWVNLAKMGEWAVVTGATDGIGKAYARELARKGLKVVLISRSLEKLNNVAKEISDEFGVETRVIDVDFTESLDIYKKISEETTGLDVGVLVNNVAISYNHPEYFLNLYEDDPDFLFNIVAANIHSVTHMTALFMPGMVEKRKGVVINLSSTSGVIPNPLLSLYSGTKAFVNKFSDDLQTEYKEFGIIIQSVQPGFVATKMSKIRTTSWFAPSPETYVKSALATLGFATQTPGYLPHALLQLVIRLLEAVLGKDFARNEVLKNISATRNRACRLLQKKL